MWMQQKAVMMYRIVHCLAPSYLTDTFTEQDSGLQISMTFEIPNLIWRFLQPKTSMFRNSFAFTVAWIWNALPELFSI